MLIILMVAAVI